MGMYMWVGSQGQIDHCLRINHGEGLAGLGLSLLLEGVVSVLIRGALLEPRDKVEIRAQLVSLRSKWKQLKSFSTVSFRYSGWTRLLLDCGWKGWIQE